MPLPMMAGDPATMMSQPGMQQQGPSAPPGPMAEPAAGGTVDPQAQQRGVVQLISQAQSGFLEVLSAIAQQNPALAKAVNALANAVTTGVRDLTREVIATGQVPEPPAPMTVR